MFDVFVSYRHADAADVRLVAQALRDAGLQIWLDESNIENFASIQRGIEEGLGNAKALLAWYSSRYPDSLACQWELTRAFTAGQQEGDPRQRVLLINPEATNGHIHPIELRDTLYSGPPHDAAALQALAMAIAGHVAKLTGSFNDIQERAKPGWHGAAAGDGSNRFFGRLAACVLNETGVEGNCGLHLMQTTRSVVDSFSNLPYFPKPSVGKWPEVKTEGSRQ